MHNAKNSVICRYLEYRNVKNAYRKQNFAITLSIVTTLISLCIMFTVPLLLGNIIFYVITIGSYGLLGHTLWKNKGFISASFFQRIRLQFYIELDNTLDYLINRPSDS